MDEDLREISKERYQQLLNETKYNLISSIETDSIEDILDYFSTYIKLKTEFWQNENLVGQKLFCSDYANCTHFIFMRLAIEYQKATKKFNSDLKDLIQKK